jgi:hypothetical protein
MRGLYKRKGFFNRYWPYPAWYHTQMAVLSGNYPNISPTATTPDLAGQTSAAFLASTNHEKEEPIGRLAKGPYSSEGEGFEG